jgi:hypothetical protein
MQAVCMVGFNSENLLVAALGLDQASGLMMVNGVAEYALDAWA